MSNNILQRPAMPAERHRFQPSADWSAELICQQPIFAEVLELFPLASLTDFPNVALLNRWFTARHPTLPYRFVDAEAQQLDGRYYEQYIEQTHAIPTRTRNWHDLFGAIIWCLFPSTKALMNQLHVQEMAQQQNKQRSALRHQLTQLDECGVVLAYAESGLPIIAALQQHRWQEAFIAKRQQWSSADRALQAPAILPIVFGHANYEMATHPFIGLTAKLLPLAVPANVLTMPAPARYQQLDALLSAQLQQWADRQQRLPLSPLPLLGVPGWYAAKQDLAFYQNSDYFRPLPQPKTKT